MLKFGSRRHRGLVLGILVTCAATRGPAQDGWRIPRHGVTQFERVSSEFSIAAPAVDRARGVRHVIRRGEAGGSTWRYRSHADPALADGFERPGFDASTWSTGRSSFGTDAGSVATTWNQRFLDARCEFTTGRRESRAAILSIRHDDYATVWLNGDLIYEHRAYGNYEKLLDAAALALLEMGNNVITVRIENPNGAGAFDLGLTLLDEPTASLKDARKLAFAESKVATKLRSTLGMKWRAPVNVFESALDDRQQKISRAGVDIRDLGPFVACDLSRVSNGGGFSVTAARTWHLGDIAVRGTIPKRGPDGSQRFELDVKSRVPNSAGHHKRYFERHVVPSFTWSLDGKLAIERQFGDDGSLREFRTTLLGKLSRTNGDGPDLEMRIDELYRYATTRKNRDGRLNEEIRTSIENGANYLRKTLQNRETGDLKNQPTGNRSYNSGRLAMSLLALVHADDNANDATVQAGFKDLAERRIIDTYSLANALMAVEAKYRPMGEFEELRAGLIDAPRKRQPSPADLKLMQRWTDLLLQNVDTRVDRGYLLRFNYVRGGRYDHSVNQYGLLGLYSAHLCGIEIPGTIWEGAAEHLIEDREKPERRLRLTLTTYSQRDDLRAGRTTTAGPQNARISGWGYYGPKSGGVPNPIYGSMTCAGITGLTICRAGLRDLGLRRPQLGSKADAAIRSGFAWLADSFTVDWHPGKDNAMYTWIYYYLYSMERACELSGVALLQGRDWYQEGALTLLSNQNADGSWTPDGHGGPAMECTAMAVLFLKKSSAPVYTQR